MKIQAFSNNVSTSYQERSLIKQYSLSNGAVITIESDPISGALGVYKKDDQKIEIPFENLSIPRELRYDKGRLQQYLEDTYLKPRHSDNGKIVSVVILQRLRGGGHSHSTHSQSYHTNSPPPRRQTPVAYSAGFPIQGLTMSGPGTFLHQTGGIGHRNFSVIFQHQDPAARPEVTLTVLKKDYYATDISNLQAAKRVSLQHKQNELTTKTQLEGQKQQIVGMLNHLQTQRNILNANQGQLKEVESQSASTNARLKISRTQLAEVSQKISALSPDIKTLIELVQQTSKLGLDLIQATHAPLQQFASQCRSYEKLLGQELNTAGILGETVVLLNKVLASAQKAEGKEIIAFFGNTGTGKSTAVNYLLGLPMEIADGKVQVAAGTAEIAKIGHRTATSETLFTEICEKSGNPLILADCGGLFDTRGLSGNMITLASATRTIKNAKGTKLVICTSANTLTSDRAVAFNETLRLALGTLKESCQKYPESILLMFTKPYKQLDNTIFDKKAALEILQEILDTLPEGSADKPMYQFLLRHGGKYVCVCDPLSNEGRGEITHILNGMKPISDSAAFKMACPAGCELTLLEEMLKTATKANELFNSHDHLSNQIAIDQRQIAALQEKIHLLNENQKAPKVEIQKAEAFLASNTLANVDAKLARNQQNIKSHTDTIASYDAGIAAKNTTASVVYKHNGSGWSISGA
jgi:hypothetical protein